MRPGEFLQVRKDQVHLEEGYLIGGFKTEAGRDRVIPIREEIATYLRDFLREQPESPYLVCNANGKPLGRGDFTKRRFYPLLDRLGIVHTDAEGNNILTPHRSRHTYISESIKGHMAPEALTKIVGHATYATSVDHYQDVVDLDYLREESRKGL